MIKIISSNTLPNGTTLALTNLCKLLNENGHECTLYGPDRWHLNKCKSGTITEFKPTKKDIIIVNDINISSIYELYNIKNYFNKKKQNLSKKIKGFLKKLFGKNKYKVQKLILTYQQSINDDQNQMKFSLFDKVHLTGDENIKSYSFKCSNPITKLKKSKTNPKKIAGIVGSICKSSNTHLSVEKAIKDKMNQVIIYGYMKDPVYFYKEVEPLIKKYPDKVKIAGFYDDQQKIYDSISDVYNSANIASAAQIKAECESTNTNFHHDQLSTIPNIMDDNQIYQTWKTELKL